MSREQRKSADNGIWLCQNCAKVIDDSEDAFPLATLMAWKRHAEAVAAKDSRSTSDEVGELINQIQELHRLINNLVLWARQNDPYRYNGLARNNMTQEERDQAWNDQLKQSHEHHSQMQAMYHAHVSPDLTIVLARSARILGAENEAVANAVRESQYASVNELGISAMGEALLRVRAELQLR